MIRLWCWLLGHRVTVQPWQPRKRGGWIRHVICGRCDELLHWQVSKRFVRPLDVS